MKNQKLLEFLNDHKLMALGTVKPDGKPSTAVVEFGQTSELELIFDTFSNSRKYDHILANPHVSAAIGWDNNVTLQIEGTAQELSGGDLELAKSLYADKNDRARRWQAKQGNAYFKITPYWMKLSDFNTNPYTIEEWAI